MLTDFVTVTGDPAQPNEEYDAQLHALGYSSRSLGLLSPLSLANTQPHQMQV